MESTSSSPPGDVSPTTTTTSRETKKLKILMLHGYAQSGPIFRSKTNALRKHLERSFSRSSISTSSSRSNTNTNSNTNSNFPYDGVELVYPTAPLKLHAADIPGFSETPVVVADPVAAGAGASLETARQAQHGPSRIETDDEQEKEAGELDAWGWWRKDHVTGAYLDLEKGLDSLATILQNEGPFEGVIGFSQGGAAAAMLGSLVEAGRREMFRTMKLKMKSVYGTDVEAMDFPASFLQRRTRSTSREDEAEDSKDAAEINVNVNVNVDVIHPPFKFVVVYSGFMAAQTCYAPLYHPPIRTPILHVIGRLDAVVEETRSRALVDACAYNETSGGERDGFVVYHPGGHFVPSQRQYLNRLVEFIEKSLVVE